MLATEAIQLFLKLFKLIFRLIFKLFSFLYRKRLWCFIPFAVVCIAGIFAGIFDSAENEIHIASKWYNLTFIFGLVVVIWRKVKENMRKTVPEFSFFYMIRNLFALIIQKKNNSTDGINLKDTFDSKFSKKTKEITEVGTVFWGKQENKYIARDIQTDNSGCGMILVGSSGCGKSTCCIANSLQLAKPNEHILCVDVKGELEQEYKKTHPTARTITFRPKSSDTWNYDPLYRIDFNEDDNPISEAKILAGALVPYSGNAQSKYFEDSAQSMLAGAILYYHQVKGMNFAEIMLKVISANPLKMVNEIMADTDPKSQDGKLCVNQFVTMKDTEAGSVYSSLKNACSVYATDKNLQRVLSKSENSTFKAKDIEDYQAIFINIDTKSINTTYSSVCGIIVSQIIDVLLERPESKIQDPVLLLLDEAPQYMANINSSGNDKTGKLETAFSVLRSKKCYILLAVQSLENLNRALGESQAKIIMDNAPWTYVMSVQDPTTQKYFADKLGKFDETQISSSKSQQLGTVGGSNSVSISKQERYKIRPELLSFLPSIETSYGMGQGLLFHPQGATLIDKVPVFENDVKGKKVLDPLFNPNKNKNFDPYVA